MSYIKISNKTDGVNRLFLEKLGLSTKRDNEDTIGQFGSGSKFAPIAALRRGWQWINVGEDELGAYQMEYISVEENGINSIYYLYDNDVLKPSSFTAEAGLLSWEDEFQIFREAFSNALDVQIETGEKYTLDIVDEITHEPGIFSVYLTAAPELLEIVEDIDKYFCINRTPLFSTNLGNRKIFEPYDAEANIYYKGVLVLNDARMNPPIFDYELNNLTLNEERRVRDHWDIRNKIVSVMSALDGSREADVEIAKRYIECANYKKWEWDSISEFDASGYYNHGTRSAFAVAWEEMHGDCVMVNEQYAKYAAQLSLRNRRHVMITSIALYTILEKSGVETIDSVLGDDIHYNFATLTSVTRRKLDKAVDAVSKFLPNFTNIINDIKVFVPEGHQDGILGVANQNHRNIYLSSSVFHSQELLIGTLIHEYDHINTGLGDSDPDFRHTADDHIGKLVAAMFGDKT